jgi:hypothetical protein
LALVGAMAAHFVRITGVHSQVFKFKMISFKQIEKYLEFHLKHLFNDSVIDQMSWKTTNLRYGISETSTMQALEGINTVGLVAFISFPHSLCCNSASRMLFGEIPARHMCPLFVPSFDSAAQGDQAHSEETEAACGPTGRKRCGNDFGLK